MNVSRKPRFGAPGTLFFLNSAHSALWTPLASGNWSHVQSTTSFHSAVPGCGRSTRSLVHRAGARWGLRALRCSSANAPMTIEGARIGPPPDLPSLLLHNRIVYIGMPLTAPVCELIIAELLYLNYNDPDKPVYVYINSTGTMGLDGSTAGFETDAFAIIDTMNYIKPPVYTICVGSAFGLAAVILACGDKGNRAALPNASIMLHQPRGTARGQAADIAIKAREIMYNRKVAMEILAEHTGRTAEECLKASERTKYMTPQEAKEFGIIDKILRSEKDLPKDMPAFLKQL
jgi:ATP-dependent Clp protease protease subunit